MIHSCLFVWLAVYESPWLESVLQTFPRPVQELPSSTRSSTTSSEMFRYMIQYIRLKQMKLTGNSILLYLSISEGDTPPIFWRFFLHWSITGAWWRRSSSCRFGGAAPEPGRRRLVEPLILFGPRRSKGSCIFKRISCKAKQTKYVGKNMSNHELALNVKKLTKIWKCMYIHYNKNKMRDLMMK